jgi:hypothetical protein
VGQDAAAESHQCVELHGAEISAISIQRQMLLPDARSSLRSG